MDRTVLWSLAGGFGLGLLTLFVLAYLMPLSPWSNFTLFVGLAAVAGAAIGRIVAKRVGQSRPPETATETPERPR